jgi:uncharacterized protein
VTVERLQLPVDHPVVETVTAAVHTPARRRGPAVLLAHGAGGDLDGAGLVALAEVLADLGCRVVRTNLPHREAGQRTAPRADRSVAAYRQITDVVRQRFPREHRWVLGGKSYGGRVASMAAAEGLDCEGLLFYGYPLHPPGKTEQLRVSHWPSVPVPCLFLQGARDPFCNIDLLEENVTKLPRRANVHVVPGGDHSLEVRARDSADGSRQDAPAVIAGLREPLRSWLASLEG